VKAHKKRKKRKENIQVEIESRFKNNKKSSLRMNEINNEAINQLFLRRNTILEERSKQMAEKLKNTWFYEGEKRNNFFIMLRKKRNLTDNTALETEQGIIEED
jgi:hypothetical protein